MTTLVQSITFENTNLGTTLGARDVTFAVNDGVTPGSAVATVSVVDPLVPTPTAIDYVQNAAPVPVDAALQLNLSSNLTEAVVR